MKNIAIVVLIVVGVAFYFFSKDNFATEIVFQGETFQLGESSGKKGVMKTYQYTASGNITGLNDYVQVFKIDKTPENMQQSRAQQIKSVLMQKYSLKEAPIADGHFGVFRPGTERDFYAYMIERDTSSAQWLATFVVQSNFADNALSGSDAKNQADEIYRSLSGVLDQVAL